MGAHYTTWLEIFSVMPAKAGISSHKRMSLRHETPAFAGVTRKITALCRIVWNGRLKTAQG